MWRKKPKEPNSPFPSPTLPSPNNTDSAQVVSMDPENKHYLEGNVPELDRNA